MSIQAITPVIAPIAARRAEDRFYVMMALTLILLNIAGFVPAIIDSGSRTAPLTTPVAAHGALFAAWLLLFLTQALLAASGSMQLHRRLGYAGVLLAVLMVSSGVLTAIVMARRGYDLSGDLNAAEDPYFVLVFQLGDLTIFAVLVTAALAFRRRAAVHKRLMLFATIGGLMSASLSHIIGHWSLLRDIEAPIILIPYTLLLAIPAIHDRIVWKRIHPVSIWVPIAVWLSGDLRARVIGPSDAWHALATWLVQ